MMFSQLCMCALILNRLKGVYNFCTKIYDSMKNYVQHVKDHPLKEDESSYILEKHSDDCVPPEKEVLCIV